MAIMEEKGQKLIKLLLLVIQLEILIKILLVQQLIQ